MTPRIPLLASALALAFAACSQSPAPTQTAATPPAAPAPAEAAPTTAPDAATSVDPRPSPGASTPAVVSDCATTITSNDAMQYSADLIGVPAGCTTFTIHLEHVGTLPVGAMGHNVVIARQADMGAIAADGMTAAPDHLKAGDSRVIAHSAMIGGGGATSVSFDVARIRDGGPYAFFCSFPGHLALMQGRLQVE